jgi:hypothetical protein
MTKKTYSFQEAKDIVEKIQQQFPDVKLYVVDAHFRAREWKLKFSLPKMWLNKGTKWYDPVHHKSTVSTKKWKCNKFGKWAYPTDKVKAKAISDILYKTSEGDVFHLPFR